MAEQGPEKLPTDPSLPAAPTQPDTSSAASAASEFAFSTNFSSPEEPEKKTSRSPETGSKAVPIEAQLVRGSNDKAEPTQGTDQAGAALSARINLPGGHSRPEKPIVSEFPLYFEVVDAQTGKITLTESVETQLLNNDAFQRFIQSLPDFSSVQFTGEVGVVWLRKKMELFVSKAAVLAELQTIFTKELQERFELSTVFDDGDFGPLKEYITKAAVENPLALTDLLNQALLYRTASERRAVLEERLIEQQVKHGDRNELRGEIVALESKRAAVNADREKFDAGFREIYGREAALKRAQKANKDSTVTGTSSLSKLMDLKPLQFLDKPAFGALGKKLGAMRPLHNISPEQQKAEDELSALYGRPVSVTEVDSLLANIKSEKERLVADPAYKNTDAALAAIQKSIAEIQERVDDLDSASAAKDQLTAGVAVARNTLFGEIAAFRAIAKQVASEFAVQLVPGTAVPKGADGAAMPEAAARMTRAEYISSLLEAGTAYTPEWVRALDTALTDEKDRRVATTMLRATSASLAETIRKEKDPSTIGAVVARQVIIGEALRALLPRGGQAEAQENIRRPDRELTKKEREELAAKSTRFIDNILLQGESIAKGQQTYTAKGFEPLSLEAARIAEALMMKDLSDLREIFTKMNDEARVQAIVRRVEQLKKLFGELGEAEKRFQDMRKYDDSKELRQIPRGLPERIAQVVQLLGKELA